MDESILDWQNEHALTDYPLTKFIGFNDVIVDASFVQFDGFVPVLKKLVVTGLSAIFSIKFDKETIDITVASDFVPQAGVRISGSDGRYFGTIVFSFGVTTLIREHAGAILTFDVPFASNTVTSINSGSGVFSIDGKYGALSFNTGITGLTQEISLSAASQFVYTGNALPGAPLPPANFGTPQLFAARNSTSGAHELTWIDNSLSEIEWAVETSALISGVWEAFYLTALLPSVDKQFTVSSPIPSDADGWVYRVRGKSGSDYTPYSNVAGILRHATTVTWNAVGYPDTKVEGYVLKTLNRAIPLHNAVNITESELVKITPAIGGLLFYLANGELNDNIAPLKKYE